MSKKDSIVDKIKQNHRRHVGANSVMSVAAKQVAFLRAAGTAGNATCYEEGRSGTEPGHLGCFPLCQTDQSEIGGNTFGKLDDIFLWHNG